MITVGNKTIGPGQPCFIAAEIGINHNGDIALAFRTIDAAVDAGVDAVKFQNYYTEDFVLNKELTYTYKSQGKEITERQFDMFKRYELTAAQLKQLKEYCDKKGVVFFSTPTSVRGINDLISIGCPLLKNGSDLLVNLDIIQAMAKTGLPTILSTGMATLAEMDDAVRSFEEAGGKELIILHCVSSYPTPASQVNLNKISSLQKAFTYPVGFSDHTAGIVAAIGSVVMGCCFIEKHFTLDKTLPGPDHYFSSDKAEMTELVKAVREIEKSMGDSKLEPTLLESESRKSFRLSCVAATDLTAGAVLTKKTIAYSRPADGFPPKMAGILEGRKLLRNIKAGEMITFNDVS
jgi:N-acetylneuraminate synthase/N,N'-diacetyllegionaminate synthase